MTLRYLMTGAIFGILQTSLACVPVQWQILLMGCEKCVKCCTAELQILRGDAYGFAAPDKENGGWPQLLLDASSCMAWHDYRLNCNRLHVDKLPVQHARMERGLTAEGSEVALPSPFSTCSRHTCENGSHRVEQSRSAEGIALPVRRDARDTISACRRHTADDEDDASGWLFWCQQQLEIFWRSAMLFMVLGLLRLQAFACQLKGGEVNFDPCIRTHEPCYEVLLSDACSLCSLQYVWQAKMANTLLTMICGMT